MNKVFLLFLLFIGFCAFAKAGIQTEEACAALSAAYPGQIQACDAKLMRLKNQKVMMFQQNPFAEKIEKLMENPTVQGLFYYDYWDFSVRRDAGRVRPYSLFAQVYGTDPAKIKKNLTPVRFLRQKVLFNRQNRAAESLQKVSEELSVLLKQNPKLARYIYPVDTYYYRNIAGTRFLSAHSYGIAIDLSPNKTQYWQRDENWQKTIQIRYPSEIVQIFEKHGFIWGGRWAHYDSMHFEYRPEFLFLKKFRQSH